MAKSVYVLMAGCIGDYSVQGIFSTETKAIKEEEKLKNNKHYHGEVCVEEWELNKLGGNDNGHLQRSI